MEELRDAISDGEVARALQIIRDPGRTPGELDGQDLEGYAPAHLAAMGGHADLIAALHAAGANLNLPLPNGGTPAHLAARDGHAAVIVALHAAGADLNTPVPDENWTLAHLAAMNGYADVITTLAGLPGHDAALNTPDGKGWTPAHLAARDGHATVIVALHAAGVNLDAPFGRTRSTPAHLAAMRGHPAVITALKVAGANLDTQLEGGATPAFVAAAHNQVAVLNALWDAGADLDLPLANGQTPFAKATGQGYTEAAEIFEAARDGRAMERVLSELERSTDVDDRNRATELRCLVSYRPFTPGGPSRPVRMPPTTTDPAGLVLSAHAARGIMHTTRRHPFRSREAWPLEVAQAFLASPAFEMGDAPTLALVRHELAHAAAIPAAAAAAAGHYSAFLGTPKPSGGSAKEPRNPQP
ncbi:MAG: ankyrin repeat domain-containing protein [Hydrogenophaga sp.]|uniref:ankyrin repeat domain-containing protein n=1 Tax=Hydrogenophaga sp. TaxID=1904254 RepID=UPI003D1240E2